MAPKPTASPQTPAPDLDAESRAQTKRWLDNWKSVGPILEAERWTRVRALTDEAAWREAHGLLQWWDSEWQGDGGEGLLLQQDVFTRRPRPGDGSR